MTAPEAAPGSHLEIIHSVEDHGEYNMPYAPAIRVHSGMTVYVAGVTAAPVYHHHPHIPEEFDGIPEDPAEQARMAMDNLRSVLKASGGDLEHVVQMFRFIKDVQQNQDAINRVMGQYMGSHRATTTTVEVVRLATDGRLVLEIAATAVVPA